MSELKSYQLVHPELLPESELCDILKKSCIEMLNFENLSKSKLVDIYKRVALPLPQRSCENKKLETNEDELWSEKTFNSEAEENSVNHCQSDRLKPAITATNCSAKKICLSTNSKTNTNQDNLIKRKCDEKDNESKPCQRTKRQKITWP